MAEEEHRWYLEMAIARKRRQIQNLEEEIKKLETELFEVKRKSPSPKP